MNCQEARKLVEDALDRRVAGSAKRKLDLHLSRCGECRAFYATEQAEHSRWFRAMNDVAAEPPHLLPADFAERLVAAVLVNGSAHMSRRGWRWLSIPKWALIAASLALMAGFVFAATAVVGGLRGADAANQDVADNGGEVVGRSDLIAMNSEAGATAAPSVPSVASAPSISSTSSNQGEKNMTMRKKAAVALAAALTANLVSATPISYAAGATDLDGKIVITYDTTEPSKIKTLVATPADGETLEVSGDAMTFAADATISMAADGKLIFANDVTADGALALDRTDGAYCDWTATKDGALSKGYCLKVGAQKIFEGKSLAEWELVNAYAYADVALTRPISQRKVGNKPAVSSSDGHGTWSYANLAGKYTPIKLSTSESGGVVTRKEYVINRWCGEYTYSARLWLDQTSGDINGVLRTAVCGKQFGRYPDKNLWQESSDLWTGWYGNSTDHGNANFFGSPYYLAMNRVVIRKIGSDVATVGFSGAVTLNGRTDIALGVKLAVLPKANSTFAAPVFSGEGDVEYQRNATLANVNLMKYATGLSVSNAQITITQNGAIPTNGVVDVWKDGVILANVSGLGAEQGISDGWFDITIRNGGEFRTQNGRNGGFNYAQLVEVDGGTLCFDYEDTSSTGNANRYVRYLTLLNGGVLTGKKVRIGNSSSNMPYWHVAGTSPSTNDIRLILVGLGSTRGFKFDVDDVAEGVDLVCNKNVETLNASSYCDFIKEGAGTMEMNAKFELLGGKAICVYGGTLLLGANSGFLNSSTSKNVELKNGGALAKKGGAQAFGTLDVLAGGGVLELASVDASMTFADSSGVSWTGSLYVKNFRDKAIRFGTSKAALTDAQQRSIRKLGGGRLYLDEDGYLVQPGIVMLIR